MAGRHDVGGGGAVAVQADSWTMIVSGRFRRGPQSVEILVVVKRIAARPIDQPDIGIGQRLAVIVERARPD